MLVPDDSRTPTEITTLTFNFVSDGSDVVIGMDMPGGRHLPFNGFALSAAPISEPSAFTLAAMGLLGLGWFGRRRRRVA